MPPAAEENYLPPDVPADLADAQAEGEESDDYDIEVGGDDDMYIFPLRTTTFYFIG